jgi:hypothetical protein
MRRVGKGAPTKIGDLFEVYRKRLRAPQSSVIEAAVEVIHDVLGVVVDKKHFSYTPHSRTLTIKTSGMLKTEVNLKKTEILTHLKGRLGPQNAPKNIL